MTSVATPSSHDSDQRSVAVVIPAFNAEATIAQTLDAVLKQTHRAEMIIVVDDGSTDGTSKLVESYSPAVTLISQTNSGPAAARNEGVRLANTAFIGFTDSDCRPSENWLRELLAGFDSQLVAGVGGRVRGIGNDLISRYVDSTHMLDPGVVSGHVEFLVTANACFRRDRLVQVGLFSEEFRKPGGEEPELCERLRAAGFELRAVPNAWVEHRHKQTIPILLRTLANYGEGRYILATHYAKYAWAARPRRALVRHLLDARACLRSVRSRRAELGLKTAIAFSFLKYLADAAFLWGYIRAGNHELGVKQVSANSHRSG